MRALVLLPLSHCVCGGWDVETEECHYFPFSFFGLCFNWGATLMSYWGMGMEPHFSLQPKPVQALDVAYGKDAWHLLIVNGCPDKY